MSRHKRSGTGVALAGALLGLLLLQPPLEASAMGLKPRVGVCFQLLEPNYRAELQESDRRELESLVSITLAEQLSSKIAFLHAETLQREDCARQPDDPLMLLVELDQDVTDGGASTIHDVVFHLSLAGTTADASEKILWPFRKKGNVFDVEYAVPVFHHLISDALERGDYENLVAKLLSRMPIPARAELFRSSGALGRVGWELVEHSHEDLCMSAQSELAVLTRFGVGDDSEEEVVHTEVTKRSGSAWRNHKIRGRVTNDRNLEDVRNALKTLSEEEVEALEIFVVKYVLLQPCGAASPQDSGL